MGGVDTARANGIKMRKVRFDVDSDTVEANPFSDADAEGRDFVFFPVFPVYPDAYPIFPSLPFHVEPGEGTDDPFFELVHEFPYIWAAFL